MNSIAGPTAPMMHALDYANVSNGSQVGGRSNWAATGNYGSTVGTASLVAPLSAYSTSYDGINWQATFTVSSGEVLYFVVDPTRTNGGQHSFEGGQDNIALTNNLVFTQTPEPSSFVLAGFAGLGLALAAWKRRRAA